MAETNRKTTRVDQSEAAASGKKPYAAPKLEVFGRIEDITKTSSGGGVDGATHRPFG